MGEAAAVTPPAGAAATPPPAAPSTAGASLASVPAPPEWAQTFKNDELKSYVAERKFTSPEQLAERYQNLEKLRGVPEDRLLKLPEKMEGDEARAIWERLGAPKDPKGYDIKTAEGGDAQFGEWAANTFHMAGLTKTQADGVLKAYETRIADMQKAKAETHSNMIKQADAALKKEWGAQYESNINLAKQGAKVLGLDAKTLDTLEALQGRDVLFKNLSRLGASVGESEFVSGAGGTPKAKSPEEAQAEIKALTQDRKFGKAMAKGDIEAVNRWNDLHKIAFPGERPIG